MTTNVLDKPKCAEVTRAERTSNRRCYRPNVDILETADELAVLVDLPGVPAEDVDIHFENGTLTILGKVRSRRPEGVTPLQSEYGIGDFHRVFQVSEKIDSAKIRAEHAHGVLTLHLPKGDAIKPRKIALTSKG